MVRYEYERPIVTVDVALFTVLDVDVVQDGRARTAKRLHVALLPRKEDPEKGAFAIPGGNVRTDEDASFEDTAARVLREKCRLRNLFVEQLRTYSGRDRDPRDWSTTTAYYALVPQHLLCRAVADLHLVPADGLKGLPFDHDEIVADGVDRVRGKATYTTLPTKLLPQKFTLTELEMVYEAVLGREIHAAGFRRKMADLTVEVDGKVVPFLQPTDDFRGGRNRPAVLYRKATNEVLAFRQRF